MIVFIGITGILSAAWALDLDEAREAAVRQSLDVERAAAQAEAARADAGVAVSSTLPSVAGFATANTGAGYTSFGFPRPVKSQYGVGLQASWTVVDPAAWTAAAAARRSAEGQEAMAEWAMVQARREATVLYTATRSAQAEREAWGRAVEDAQEATRATASLVDAGMRPASDLAQLRAAEAIARSRLADAEGRAAARCAELMGLLREPATGPCSLEPTLDLEAAPRPDRAHPALRAASAAQLASRAGLRSTMLSYGPSVDLSATAAQYLVTGGEPGPGWSAGVSLSVPLVASGMGVQAWKGADAELREATLALEAQERDLEVAQLSAQAQLDAARASLAAQRAASEAADEALRQVDERYRAGLTGVTEWLDARRVRDDAAAGLAQAEAALGAAVAELEAATGVW
ncbi:MAG: TolC family protein [Alphaproteobacteria bacterium]|nr:TolC family protein [Alphaproteobacteria bacterium]